MKIVTLPMLVAVVMLGITFAAHAVELDAVDEIVKYRQAVMKSQGAHMAAAAAIIQGKVPFKGQLAAHVNSIESTSREIDKLFPRDTDTSDSKAMKGVWSNNDEFLKHARDAQQKSAALAKAVAANDTLNFGPRLKDMLETCKSCHKDFRKKEEK